MTKRKELIRSYEDFKMKSFYGVGQRKAKLFMNSLQKELEAQIKTTPGDAQLMYRLNALLFLRAILECENCNINAKKYFNTDGFSYQDHNYNRKHALINELFSPPQTIGLNYGYVKSNNPVSFHSDIDQDKLKYVPVYNKEWDQLVNSSLSKIEKSFCVMFGEELKKRYKIAA